MALTQKSHYKAIVAPDYNKYDKTPIPNREKSDRVVYWLDALYLTEWAAAISVVSGVLNEGQKQPPSRVIRADELVPIGTMYEKGYLTVGTLSSRTSVLSLLLEAANKYGAGGVNPWIPAPVLIWVKEKVAKGMKDSDVTFTGRVSGDILDSAHCGNVLCQIVMGTNKQPPDPNEPNVLSSHPELFLSSPPPGNAQAIPVDDLSNDTIESILEIRPGALVRLAHMEGLYDLCRIFKFCLVSVPLSSLSGLKETSRTYTRDYRASSSIDFYREGLYQLTSDNTYPGSPELQPEAPGTPGYEWAYPCLCYNAINLRVVGGPEKIVIEGDVKVAENDETQSVSESATTSLVLYKRELIETVHLNVASSESTSYYPKTPWSISAKVGEDDTYDAFKVCEVAQSLIEWEQHLTAFSHSLQSTTVDCADTEIIIDLPEGNPVTSELKALLMDGLYPDNSGTVYRALVSVSVEFSAQSELEGKINETISPQSSCSDDRHPSTGWAVDSTLPDPKSARGTYVIPVKVTVDAKGNKLSVSYKEVLEALSSRLPSGSMAQGDVINQIAKSTEVPEVPKGELLGGNAMALLPGKHASIGDTLGSSYVKYGTVTREPSSGCYEGYPNNCGTSYASRHYGVTVSLTGSLVFLYEWKPPVCLDA